MFEYIHRYGLMESHYYPYKSGKQSKVIFNCRCDKSLVDKILKIPWIKKLLNLKQ